MTKGHLPILTRTLFALTLVSYEVSLQVITKRPIYASLIPSVNRINSRQPQTKEPIAPIIVTPIASEIAQDSYEYPPVLSGDGSQYESHVLLPTVDDSTETTEILDHALDSGTEEQITGATNEESSDLDTSAIRPRSKIIDVPLKGAPASTTKYPFVKQTVPVLTQKSLIQTTSKKSIFGTSTTLTPSLTDSATTKFSSTSLYGRTEKSKINTDSPKTEGQGSGSKVKTKQRSICDSPICNCTNLQVICRCRDNNTGIDIQQNVHWLPPETEELQVANCGYIGLRNGCLASLRQLRKAEFNNIKDVVIDTNGLHIGEAPKRLKREILLSFTRVSLQPGSITGQLGDLTFINVTINSIGNSSFKDVVLETLTVFGSEVTTIEKSGFDNCSIKWLNITGSELQQIKPEAIDINGLTDVILDVNIIGDIHKDSISIRGDLSSRVRNKFWFENNVVQKVWRHGISVSNFDVVHIARNWFKNIEGNAFERIRSSESRRLNCTFVNNELHSYERSAMIFSSPLIMENIKLPDPCSCALNGHVGQWLVGVSNPIKGITDGNMSKGDKIWSKEELGTLEDALMCRESGRHQYLKDYYMEKCLRTPREKAKNQTLCNFHNFCSCHQKLGSNISRTVVDCTCDGKPMSISPLSGPEKIPDDTAELRIKRCSTLFIRDQSMAQLNRLEELEFEDIEKIITEQNGLSILSPLPSLKIKFKEVGLRGGSFRGRFESLTFNNVQFLSPLTSKFFADLTLNKMTFYRSNLTDVQKGAFQNVNISNMTINECNISAIREEGISIIAKEEVSFLGNKIIIMDRKSIEIKWPEGGTSGGLLFANNSIETIQKEALVTRAPRPVVFQDNIFESSFDYAFHGLEQNTQQCLQQCVYYKPDFIFENNEFQNFDKRVIIVPPYFKVKRLKLNTQCTCKLSEDVTHLLAESSVAITTDTDSKATSRNLQTISNTHPQSFGSVLMCHEISGNYISIEDYEDGNCGMKDSENLVFKIAIPIAAVLFLIMLVVMAICLFRRTKALREKEKKTEQLQEQITSLNMFGPVLWDKRQRAEQTISLQPDILADAKKSDRADSWVINTPSKEILLHPKFLAQAQVNELEDPHIYEIPEIE